MRKLIVLLLLVGTSTAWGPTAYGQTSSPLSTSETEATIIVSRGTKPVVVYNKQSPPVPKGIDPVYQRSGFLHPVATPAGKVVTATFPIDHAHQHGIFSAWVKTTYNDREIDFWNIAGQTGRVLHERVVSTFDHAAGSGFVVELIHQTAQEPIVDILQEKWNVVAYPTDGSFYCFDIVSTQEALTDQPLIVQEYHYGGMALRGRTEWLAGKSLTAADGEPLPQEPSGFLNDLGSDRVEGNHERARWVSLYGQIDGNPVSITVLCHAENFRAPQAARIHPTKPYFCFAPCVDGEFAIDEQHPLVARYRYLVTDAEPDVAWIEEQWRNWCGEQNLAPVSGVVTLDGKPLASARIEFYPTLGGKPSSAITDEFGKYRLRLDQENEAARVGRGIFLISTKVWDEPTQQWSKERLRKSYSEEGLEFEVRPGRNICDFDLKTE